MKLISSLLGHASPGLGLVAYENSYYTRSSGPEKMRLRSIEVSCDIFDHGIRSFSTDNGQSWTHSEPCVLGEKRPTGMLRRLETTGFVDPVNGLLVHITNEGLLPNDDSLDGMTAYYLTCRVSADGGHSALVNERIIEQGYSAEHPFEPVHIGRNAMCTGGENALVRTPQGHLLLAISFSPTDADGNYHRPAGIWNRYQVLVLVGNWQEGGRIAWQAGPTLELDVEQSTRGASEPSLMCMPDGRILMVMRAGNDGRPDLGGYKYSCESNDGGASWTAPQPWRYSDGTSFYSPGSVSQLLTHSNGRFYWLGNICPKNPAGNIPRYPLVIAEIDPESLLLRRETVFEIDGLKEGEDPSLALSNFSAHEERPGGDILLHCTRMFTPATGWHGNSYQYRLRP